MVRSRPSGALLWIAGVVITLTTIAAVPLVPCPRKTVPCALCRESRQVSLLRYARELFGDTFQPRPR